MAPPSPGDFAHRHPTRGRSARAVIESTPRIATHEESWYKERGRPGELIPASVNRSADTVERRLPLPSFRSEIHSHPHPVPHDFFSASDMRRYFDYFLFSEKNPSLKTRHLVILDERGRVKGYVSIRARGKLYALARKKDSSLMRIYNRIRVLASIRNKAVEEYLEFFGLVRELRQMGLLLHASPMPGFAYRGWRFVPR